MTNETRTLRDAAAATLGVHPNTVKSWLDQGVLASLGEADVAALRDRIYGEQPTLWDAHIPVSDLAACDEAASVAHDYIWGKNGVTKQRASDAIWRIHNLLRPHLPMDDETRAAVREEVNRDTR